MPIHQSTIFHTFPALVLKKIVFLPPKYNISYFMDNNIGTIIKERRAQLGISQQDLAEFAGVGIATVKDIERGAANPSLFTLQKLMEVLGLEMVFRRKDSFNTNQN